MNKNEMLLPISVKSSGWFDRFFGEANAKEAFKFISDIGFEAFDYEIGSRFPYADILNADKDTLFSKSVEQVLERFAPVKKAIEETGFAPLQAHASVPLRIFDDEEKDAHIPSIFEKQLAICAYLGISAIATHPCEHRDKETEKKINLEMYRRLIPIAKKYGVTVCIENLPCTESDRMAACADANEAKWYVDTLNGEALEEVFGVCFDLGHATVGGKCNVCEYIRTLGSRIKIIHLHDNDGKRDQHLAPMTLHVADWEGLIEGLIAIGYRGPINFETTAAIENKYPEELIPSMLKYVCDVGNYIRKRILANE